MKSRLRFYIAFALFFFLLIYIQQPTTLYAQDDTATNTVTTLTGSNIRSGPSVGTTVLGSVPGGTVLTVTGRSGTGWWRVESPFGTGWVSAKIVTFRGDRNAIPVTSEPSGISAPSTVIATTAPVKIYSNPNINAFVVAIIPTGDTATITGITEDGIWYQVDTNGISGFVNSYEIARRGPLESVPAVSDPGPSFRGPTVQLLTDQPLVNANGDVIGILPAGTTLPVLGRNSDNTRWQVASEIGVGFIGVGNVSLAGSSNNIRIISGDTIEGPPADDVVRATATVIVDRKLFYRTPSYTAVILDARRGEVASIIARSPDGLWLQAVIRNNVLWMNFSGVTIRGDLAALPVVDGTPERPPNVIIVNTFALNIRSGPGPDYEVIATAAGGSQLNPTGRHPNQNWWRVEGDYGVGWVNVRYILFRGYVTTVPVVTEPIGELAKPYAMILTDRSVYSTPDESQEVGVLPAGTQYNVVARTDRWSMLQLDTPLGLVWINYGATVFRGNPDLVPLVSQ